MNQKTILFVILCLLPLLCSACNSKARLTGQARFEDGEPLSFGTVYVANDVMMYRGSIGEDGTFDVGELRDGDGVPPGTYAVWLEDVNTWEPVLDKNGQRTEKIVETIVMNPQFAKRNTSGITFEVKPGGKNKMEIVVSRP